MILLILEVSYYSIVDDLYLNIFKNAALLKKVITKLDLFLVLPSPIGRISLLVWPMDGKLFSGNNGE